MLVLVIGDLYIPSRETGLPTEFQKILVSGKIEMILCTGNLCNESTLDMLLTISPNIHATRGEFDEVTTFPEFDKLTILDYKIGIFHGHQIVPYGDTHMNDVIRRQMDVDILISGSSHKLAVRYDNDKLFIDPGSATGAFHPLLKEVIPSFILMNIQNDDITIYKYEIVNNELITSSFKYARLSQ